MRTTEDGQSIALLQQIAESVHRSNLFLDNATSIPTRETEETYDVSGTAVAISTQPKSSNTFLVRQVICFVPVNAPTGGVLTIGAVTIPVPAGLTSLRWYQQIHPDSARQLVSSIPGTMSLVLMGDLISRQMLYR